MITTLWLMEYGNETVPASKIVIDGPIKNNFSLGAAAIPLASLPASASIDLSTSSLSSLLSSSTSISDTTTLDRENITRLIAQILQERLEHQRRATITTTTEALPTTSTTTTTTTTSTTTTTPRATTTTSETFPPLIMYAPTVARSLWGNWDAPNTWQQWTTWSSAPPDQVTTTTPRYLLRPQDTRRPTRPSLDALPKFLLPARMPATTTTTTKPMPITRPTGRKQQATPKSIPSTTNEPDRASLVDKLTKLIQGKNNSSLS